jgi:predicted amino acid racemase
MFLEKLLKENQRLVDYTLLMHKTGALLPDTYVIDVDQIVENGTKIVEACGNDITPLFMLKQLGRNPYIAKKLVEAGFKGAVAVDFKDCIALMKHNIPICHAGHLVQIPTHFIKELLEYGVDHITVYSYEKAVEINKYAIQLGITQKVLLKVYSSKEDMYNGQLSGFSNDDILNVAKKVNSLTNVTLDGLTTFPAFIYSMEAKDIVKTPNLEALLNIRKLLEDNDIVINELNLPSSNCVYNVSLARVNGATIIEPGHALSGTTMMHAMNDLEEKISYVYLTEVSHMFENQSLVYGGGYYARGKLNNAVVSFEKEFTKAHQLSPESIDYHLQIDGTYEVGTPVLMCYRTQMFVTRSDIALVEGLRNNNPKLVGIYDTQGSAK